MPSNSYKPAVRLGLLGAIGQVLCWITGILLLGVPYKYWLYASELEHFNLPAFLAGVTPQQWIMALVLWMGPYLGLLVLPGAYLRELNVRYELRKLRLPMKTGVWILNGKGYFYPIGDFAKQMIAAFSAQTGLPLSQSKNVRPVGFLMILLSLPLFPMFESACTSPLLTTDSGGRTVYLCGLRFSASDGVHAGTIIGLHGRETDYGFYHERQVTLQP